MSSHRLLFTMGLLAAGSGLAIQAQAAAPAGAARVEVSYVNPAKFTDVRDCELATERGQQENLAALRRIIEERASSALPAGYTLAVSVTDVDLAGDFEPWRTKLQDVRIVRDFYPPRITLGYTLTAPDGTRVLSVDKRELVDLAFMQSDIGIDRHAPFRYEASLIADWVRREIAPAVKR